MTIAQLLRRQSLSTIFLFQDYIPPDDHIAPTFSYDMAPVLKPIIVSISYFMMRINATTTKRRNWSENYTIIINLYFIELSLLLQNF